MCGRYQIERRRLLEIEQFYGVDDVNDLDIWNGSSISHLAKWLRLSSGRDGHRRLTAGFWSLLPPWANRLDYASGITTFNAKAETLARSHRSRTLSERRCIVPAEAFYEWVGPKGKKQPLHISRRDGNFLSMAGLFNYWKSTVSGGRPIPTFSIVTTEPNQWMARIHNRMPVILQDDQIETWLDLSVSNQDKLNEFLKALPEDFLDCYPVDPKLLNSGLVDKPECSQY